VDASSFLANVGGFITILKILSKVQEQSITGIVFWAIYQSGRVRALDE
jgi:hypothetical protein